MRALVVLVLVFAACSRTVGETVDGLRPELERIHAHVVATQATLPKPGEGAPQPIDVADISYGVGPARLDNTAVFDMRFMGEGESLDLFFARDRFQNCWEILQSAPDDRTRARSHPESVEECERVVRVRYVLLVRTVEFEPARLVDVPARKGVLSDSPAETGYFAGRARLEWTVVDLERAPAEAVRGRFVVAATTPDKVEYVQLKGTQMSREDVIFEIHEELVMALKIQATEALRPHVRRLFLGNNAPYIQN